MPFVLLFWWSCPLCCVFFSSWCCGWQGCFDAGHCYWCLSAGLFFFLLVLVCWRLEGFCPPGVFVFFPRVVVLAFVLWHLSFCALGLCFLLSNCPLLLLLMVCVVFCASGLLLFFLLPFLLFFPSFFLFFLFLAFFFFGCLCSLWSPSCFPFLVLPGVWPSLVFGLVGPS